MLECKNTVLVVIDVQGSLAQAMFEKELLFDNLVRLIAGVKVFAIPIILTEQNPSKLGKTLPQISQAMPEGVEPIAKMSFSCCGTRAFNDALADLKRTDVLLAGIEAHICVYQTAVDLLHQGFKVHIVTDAVSSRFLRNRDLALMKMHDCGAALTSVEMALFELLKTADSPQFKKIAGIVK